VEEAMDEVLKAFTICKIVNGPEAAAAEFPDL